MTQNKNHEEKGSDASSKGEKQSCEECVNNNQPTFISSNHSFNSKNKPMPFTIKLSECNQQFGLDPVSYVKSQDDFSLDFANRSEYLKYRKKIVKKIKLICTKNKLSFQTFFTSICYLDNICSKFFSFHYETILVIAQFCLIISAKFNENGSKAFEFQKKCINISKNFKVDEICVLKLLDYDLNKITPFDILHQVMQYGFVFNSEHFIVQKLYFFYTKMEEMLFHFCENSRYIYFSPKQTVLGMIGFVRENLGLEPFSPFLKECYEIVDVNSYLIIVSQLRNVFKLKEKGENTCTDKEMLLEESCRDCIMNKKDEVKRLY